MAWRFATSRANWRAFLFIHRLRNLLSKVERDDIERDELKRNLEYIVAILDAVFFDDTR